MHGARDLTSLYRITQGNEDLPPSKWAGLEAYNLSNSFMASDPNLNVYSSLFGRSTGQANTGRQMQYTLRLHF